MEKRFTIIVAAIALATLAAGGLVYLLAQPREDLARRTPTPTPALISTPPPATPVSEPFLPPPQAQQQAGAIAPTPPVAPSPVSPTVPTGTSDTIFAILALGIIAGAFGLTKLARASSH